MKRALLLTITLATLATTGVYANMILDKSHSRLKVFESQTDLKGWTAVVKGVVIGFSSREDLSDDNLSDYKHEKTRTTIRLYNKEGLRAGSTLYVINNKNLIVGRLRVKQLFRSASFGDMLIGHGNFILCNNGDRVVLRVFDEYAKYAFVHKARGDFFLSTGETGKAISEYKRSIELDHGYPEAHFALGKIYLEQEMLQFAFKEFSEAYRQIARLADNEDRYLLLKHMAEIRFREVLSAYLPYKLKNSYRNEGIKYGKEALSIHPSSVEVNYLMGMFYHRHPENFDTNARDYFLKVIESKPYHAGANIALAELYFKHRNRVKARRYITSALKSEPENRRARQLLKYIDKYR
jgi:tetratricopeptide (TPR) repeat protein